MSLWFFPPKAFEVFFRTCVSILHPCFHKAKNRFLDTQQHRHGVFFIDYRPTCYTFRTILSRIYLYPFFFQLSWSFLKFFLKAWEHSYYEIPFHTMVFIYLHFIRLHYRTWLHFILIQVPIKKEIITFFFVFFSLWILFRWADMR